MSSGRVAFLELQQNQNSIASFINQMLIIFKVNKINKINKIKIPKTMKLSPGVKTPVKKGNTQKQKKKEVASTEKGSAKSTAAKSKSKANTNIKVKNQSNSISNAIEQFVRNTLQPLLGSKQQNPQPIIKALEPKNISTKNNKIVKANKVSPKAKRPVMPVSPVIPPRSSRPVTSDTQKSSFHRKCVESYSINRPNFGNSVKDLVPKNSQQKQQIQARIEKGKSSVALKFINQQMKKLKKQRQTKILSNKLPRNQSVLKSRQKVIISSPSGKKESKKQFIDLNITQKHQSGRVSLLKEELKQETQKIYNIKSTSDRKLISELQRAQNQMKNHLKVQMANSQQMIKESNRAQQILALKHKQQVQQMNRQIQQMSAKLRQTQEKRKQMEIQAQNYAQQISTVKRQLNQRHSQFEALNRSNQQFFMQHDKMHQNVKIYQNTISSLERKIQQMQGNSKRMQEKLRLAQQQKKVIKKNAQDVLMMLRQQYKSTNGQDQQQDCDGPIGFDKKIYGAVQNFF